MGANLKIQVTESVPMSPATSASNPEKMMAQSAKYSGKQSLTTIFLTIAGIGVVCFQLTALGYSLFADREDAPKAWIINHGCAARRVIKRCPTVPVAPRTPTLIWRVSCMEYLGYFANKRLEEESGYECFRGILLKDLPSLPRVRLGEKFVAW